MLRSLLLCLFLIMNFGCSQHKYTMNSTNVESTELNRLSEKLLSNIKNQLSTLDIQNQLSKITIEEIEAQLITDEQKFAFWINIYNAFIQIILTEHPEYYEDRRTFFAKEQIPLANRLMSFKQIEHGFIRKSQWELGLGYIRTWFTDKIERQLRVKNRDFRIHFALNCGAKDCPPVRIYKAETIGEQLDMSTKVFLKHTTKYSSNNRTATVSSLFSWFRGDFGGKKGIKKVLRNYTSINSNSFTLNYAPYDWTLDLSNFYFDE